MRKLAFFLFATLLLCSCREYSLVNSETYNNADLKAYKTFRILTPAEGIFPPGMEALTFSNISDAIRVQMLERGFMESDDSPMIINIGVTIHSEMENAPGLPTELATYNGPFYSGIYPSFVYPRNKYLSVAQSNEPNVNAIYKEGVLTLDFVNIRNKVALYTASVSTILDKESGHYKNGEGINEAVETLFSNFPVPVSKQYLAGL